MHSNIMQKKNFVKKIFLFCQKFFSIFWLQKSKKSYNNLMKTRQRTYESENSEYEEGLENSENLDSKEQIREEIQTTVDERGFYLYEWISREELKMSIRADYLNIATKSSIPLAIVTFVMGVIGFALGNITGIILAIFGILFFFYLFVGIFLIFKMLQK